MFVYLHLSKDTQMLMTWLSVGKGPQLEGRYCSIYSLYPLDFKFITIPKSNIKNVLISQ